jgi:hypothetical protein
LNFTERILARSFTLQLTTDRNRIRIARILDDQSHLLCYGAGITVSAALESLETKLSKGQYRSEIDQDQLKALGGAADTNTIPLDRWVLKMNRSILAFRTGDYFVAELVRTQHPPEVPDGLEPRLLATGGSETFTDCGLLWKATRIGLPEYPFLGIGSAGQEQHPPYPGAWYHQIASAFSLDDALTAALAAPLKPRSAN